MRPLCLSVLLLILASSAFGDVIVNDRTLDPPGVAQYRPSLAVVNTLEGNQQVCVWQEQRAGNVRDFRVAVSTASQFAISWVQHGAPPAPTGYDWLEDVLVASTSCTGGDGNFILVGQVRTNAAAPYTYGIGMVTGHVVDENTLTWGTPRVLITFGSQSSTSRFFDALSLASDPCAGVVYLGFLNTLPASPYVYTAWLLRSTNLGTSWDAPKSVGNDTTQAPGPPRVQIGGYAGRLTLLWSVYTAGISEQMYSTNSFDYGTTLSAPIAGPTEPVDTQSSPFGVSSSVGPHTTASEALFTSHFGSLFYASGEQMNSNDVTFPNPATSPGLVEHEPDNHAAQATLVSSPGVVLRGTLGGTAPNDTDYYSFSLSAGQSVMMNADSIATNLSVVEVEWHGPDGTSILTSNKGGFLAFTAPVAGTYYLMLTKLFTNANTGGYRVRTLSAAPPVGGSRDQRDLFMWELPDGGAWGGSTNVSALTAPTGYDEDGVTLLTPNDGYLYAGWYDWTAQPAKEISRYMLARSPDGGATWETPVPLTSANSDWSQVASLVNTSALAGPWQDAFQNGKEMYYVWTDGRNGDADLYSRLIRDDLDLLSQDYLSVSLHAGERFRVHFNVQNENDLFGWNVLLRGQASYRGWPLTEENQPLDPGATQPLEFFCTVPDTAAPGPVSYQVDFCSSLYPHVIYAIGFVTVNVLPGAAGVGASRAELSFAGATPNPAATLADISFSLSRGGPVKLEIFGVDGRRVKTLANGVAAAGAHVRSWNGTDDAGARVGSGTYFLRLEAEGRSLTKRMVWLR